MISPKKQKIIQIEITNCCPHRCSNCTRFVGHHKKPFFMSFAKFKKAIASMKGYKGMVGIMGGEPTLHPQFEKFVKYYAKKIPERTGITDERLEPVRDFVDYRNRNLADIKHRRGLWSSLGSGYYKHHELIQDTFAYQCINDHTHAGSHLALMLPCEELGFTRKEFIKYRDKCWIQTEWSASISPKGAFFCEVAAALDMLFDGPGGWPVEPGWWERDVEDFEYQLNWCDICSACLPVPAKQANEGIDIVSPAMLRKLKKIKSPKVKRGMVEVFNVKKYNPDDYKVNYSPEPYVPDGDNSVRVSATNKSIHPRKVEAVVVCVNYDDYLNLVLPHNVKLLDRLVVVTDDRDKKTVEVCKKHGADCIVSGRVHEDGAVLAKGKAVNDGINELDNPDWILVMDSDIILSPVFRVSIDRLVLNPGVLYYARRWGPARIEYLGGFLKHLNAGISWNTLFDRFASRDVALETDRHGNDIECFPYGYFQLFNSNAGALRGRDPVYVEGSDTAEWDDSNFGMTVFDKKKRKQMPSPEFDVIHLPHGMFRENWAGRKSPRVCEALRPDGTVRKIRWKCINKCPWAGTVWDIGDIYEGRRLDVPPHFERVS